MKVLVTYYSETGNTEKVAKAIYDGIQRAEKEILPIEEVASVDVYDLIFCGFLGFFFFPDVAANSSFFLQFSTVFLF